MIDFFTKQERLIIVFLIAGLLIGGGARIFHSPAGFNPNSAEELRSIEKQIIEKSKTIDSLILESEKNFITHGENEDSKLLKRDIKLKSIDINNAGIEDLILLPNVGPALANRIIEYRKKNGRFQTIEALLKVKGIGEKKVASFRKYVFITDK